jgi:hypothetical protein
MMHKALENARTLKEKAEYSTVYINPDNLRKRRNRMNAALSEVDDDGRRYAIDKSVKKWYWGVRWGELHHIDNPTERAFKAFKTFM